MQIYFKGSIYELSKVFSQSLEVKYGKLIEKGQKENYALK